jgi:GNAT superfamily N-acetyltransferase
MTCMMEAPRRYETRAGTLTLRLERKEDEPFLFELFASHTARPLRQGGLDEAVIAPLVAMQYRSADSSWRAQFPNAVYSVIECEGESIGRLIEEDEGDAVYFVDYALMPDRQKKGLGTELIDLIADEWAERARGARVEVLTNNYASLKLCSYCGFVETKRLPSGYIELRRDARLRAAQGG